MFATFHWLHDALICLVSFIILPLLFGREAELWVFTTTVLISNRLLQIVRLFFQRSCRKKNKYTVALILQEFVFVVLSLVLISLFVFGDSLSTEAQARVITYGNLAMLAFYEFVLYDMIVKPAMVILLVVFVPEVCEKMPEQVRQRA